MSYIIYADLFSSVSSAVELVIQMEEYLPPTMIEAYHRLLVCLADILSAIEEICELRIRQNAIGRPSLEVEQSQLRFMLIMASKSRRWH